MLYFIVGVLVGWLAEWLFFTFFLKGDSQSGNSAKANALQVELNAKKKEIQELKTKLSSSTSAAPTSTQSSSSAQSTSAQSTARSSTAKTKASTAPAASKTSSSAKSTVSKTTDSQKAVTTKKEAASKPANANKASAKPVAPNKAAPKKATAKKVVTNAKSTKTPVTKTATAKKSTPKKVAAKKPVASKASVKKTTKGDDFTRLSGIGPSMATTLNDLGIDTYKKLAVMDDDILRDMLEASGARLNNNKDAMDSWNEQATLADKGDFAGLKKLQDALKK